MNKSIRKLLSVVFALSLLLSVALPAYADGTLPEAEALQAELPESQEAQAAPEDLPEAELTGELTGEPQASASPEEGSIAPAAPASNVLDANALAGPTNEFYVADYAALGEGDGSYDAPFATLAEAAAAANAAESDPVMIVLLTDLISNETARFYSGEVHILSDGEPRSVIRGESFRAENDEDYGDYNPALIECGFIRGDEASTLLFLENVVLDDAGLAQGADFTQPQPWEDNTERAQRGILAVYNGAEVVLCGTELRNYGGLSAVFVGEGGTLTIEADSCIRDTANVSLRAGQRALTSLPADGLRIADGAQIEEHILPAAPAEEVPAAEEEVPSPEEEAPADEESPAEEVSADEESPAEEAPTAEETPAEEAAPADGASTDAEETPADEGEAPADEDAPAQEASLIGEIPDPASLTDIELAWSEAQSAADGMSSLDFTAPASISRITDGLISYTVPYSLSFSLTDSAKSLIEAASGLVQGSSGTVSIQLDSRLSPDTNAAGELQYTLDSQVFAVTSTEVNGSELRIHFRLSDAWAQYLNVSGSAMGISFDATLPYSSFAEDEFLISTASVTLTIQTSSRNLDLSSQDKTASTRMLGVASASVSYDANGGTGAPATEFVPAQTGYPLNSETVPTHADENGKPVVFIGWTTTRDTTVYAAGDTAPATVETIDVAALSTTTVYAVYGYDENEDGIADVSQVLVTLSYDANGGEGAPDPETKAAVAEIGARFDISEVEPTRRYYTFQGWSKDQDATEADYKYDAEKKADRDLVIVRDTTLYAVWEQNPSYTLYYNANGGTGAPAAQSGVSENGVVRLTISSTVPTRSGYSFLGWGTSRSGSAAYSGGDEVQIRNGNVMLYAIWQRSSSSSYSYGGGTGSGTSSTRSGSAPKTGDLNNPVLYVVIAVVSLAAVGAVVWLLTRGRRRRK